MPNLDLEIKKALTNKIDLDHITLFTVKGDFETKINFTIKKDQSDQRTIVANYDQMPYRIEHSYKNVTITYSTWSDERCDDVTDEINIHYETKRTINKNDELAPIVKEMIQEIIEAKTHHMQN